MANANITKIGDAVKMEKAADVPASPVPAEPVAPNVSENRIVGKREVPTPYGHTIIVENL